MAVDTLSKLISAAIKSVPGGNAISNSATKALSNYGSGSSSSSKSSSSSTDWFADRYKSNISGLASYNNVDSDTAKSMLLSNLTGGGQYKGGGVLDYGTAGADAKLYQSQAKARWDDKGNDLNGTGITSPVAYNHVSQDDYTRKMINDLASEDTPHFNEHLVQDDSDFDESIFE